MLNLAVKTASEHHIRPAWRAFSELFAQIQRRMPSTLQEDGTCHDPVEQALWVCWCAALEDPTPPEVGHANPWWGPFAEWHLKANETSLLRDCSWGPGDTAVVTSMLWRFWQSAKGFKHQTAKAA